MGTLNEICKWVILGAVAVAALHKLNGTFVFSRLLPVWAGRLHDSNMAQGDTAREGTGQGAGQLSGQPCRKKELRLIGLLVLSGCHPQHWLWQHTGRL